MQLMLLWQSQRLVLATTPMLTPVSCDERHGTTSRQLCYWMEVMTNKALEYPKFASSHYSWITTSSRVQMACNCLDSKVRCLCCWRHRPAVKPIECRWLAMMVTSTADDVSSCCYGYACQVFHQQQQQSTFGCLMMH